LAARPRTVRSSSRTAAKPSSTASAKSSNGSNSHRRGILWTFTSQHFRPTSPPYAGADDAQSFRPFTIGYVELPGALHVEARLTEPDPAKLRIGQEMELVIEPFGVDAEGNQTMIYAFAPVAEEG
jgi:uncharacterized OB-fold protein